MKKRKFAKEMAQNLQEGTIPMTKTSPYQNAFVKRNNRVYWYSWGSLT